MWYAILTCSYAVLHNIINLYMTCTCKCTLEDILCMRERLNMQKGGREGGRGGRREKEGRRGRKERRGRREGEGGGVGGR